MAQKSYQGVCFSGDFAFVAKNYYTSCHKPCCSDVVPQRNTLKVLSSQTSPMFFFGGTKSKMKLKKNTTTGAWIVGAL